jgi:DNA-binding GntR family transcriptional regulator
MSGRFERPPTAVEAVLAEMRCALLEGDLLPGARINANQLAADLGVSRAPLRDALRVLEGEEQVEYAPHRGYVVTKIALEDLFDIYRMRELLESEAAALAVPNLGAAELDAMRAAAAETAAAIAANDRVTATHANRTFHFVLFDASQHPRLVRVIAQLWNSDAYRSMYFADEAQAARSQDEHARIIEAAAAGDADALAARITEHRDGALRGLLEVIARTDPDELPAAPGDIDPSQWRPQTIATRI